MNIRKIKKVDFIKNCCKNFIYFVAKKIEYMQQT